MLATDLWSKIAVGPVPEYAPGLGHCLIWTGARTASDWRAYGTVRFRGRNQCAHRVLYEVLVGPIPDDLEPDHLCRVRLCVRPSHVELVTHRENVLRGTAHEWHRAITHCPQGHEYTPANTLVHAGRRNCLTCKRARNREAMRRKRALARASC